MSRPLLKFLDWLGRAPHQNLYAKKSVISADVQQWSAENLFKVWSPTPQSPWFAYAKATLFASADSHQTYLSPMTPPVSKSFQDALKNLTDLSWADSRTAILADLPQDESVIAGTYFAERYGYQPVALFNNWPHPMGIVYCEVVLAGLVSMASQMASLSRLNAQSPPIFMAENSRLGNRQPNENDFDNRYFLSQEDLPPAFYLKQHGISRVCYLYRRASDSLTGILPRLLSPGGNYIHRDEVHVETDDLNPYLCALANEGIEIFKVSAEELGKFESFSPEARKTILSSTSLFSNSVFSRAAAGGFGALVPPSSSGG